MKNSSSHSLLIIDDDEAFGRRLTRSFERRGHMASWFRDGNSALSALQARHFDSAVVDLRLEGENGIEVVSKLREREPALRIVILTGYGSIATAKDALRRGALDYLTKPTDAVEIEQALWGQNDPKEGRAAVDESTVPSLKRIEWEYLQRVLADTDGNISETARRLGIERRTVQRKLSKYPPLD
ncbi:MAG: response regulator [Verrucomicrobia bacterium]|jgi:two-component system response regulator RegA|nr:response regulator [Verrucomicrobiota bacterium]